MNQHLAEAKPPRLCQSVADAICAVDQKPNEGDSTPFDRFANRGKEPRIRARLKCRRRVLVGFGV